MRIGVPMLALALVMLVGGSVQLPLGVMSAEIVSVAAWGWWVTIAGKEDWRAATPVLAAAAVIALLGIIQLTPLPMDMWTKLPGHDRAAAIVAATGTAAPHPLSLDPDATFACLIMTITGLAFALNAISARDAEVSVFATGVIAVAVLSALLGALQVGGGDGFDLYPYTHRGVSVGIFANRNHHADLQMIAMLLLAGKIRDREIPYGLRTLFLGLLGLFALSVVMTGSRLGMAILPFASIASILLVFARPGSPVWRPFLSVMAIAGIAAFLAVLSAPIHHLVARYGTLGSDDRYIFWANTRIAIANFWPTGSGVGTFVPVYNSVEALETLPRNFVNDAHNDYLELLLETGIFAVLAFAAYASLIAHALIKGKAANGHRVAAALGIAVILAHSLGDYPLRTPALLAVFGLLNGLLLRVRTPPTT